MTGSINKVTFSGQLGPMTGVVGAMTSGVGLAILVTLRALYHITGWEAAFPLEVTCFDWVGGLTGATVCQTQCGATGPESTVIMSA